MYCFSEFIIKLLQADDYLIMMIVTVEPKQFMPNGHYAMMNHPGFLQTLLEKINALFHCILLDN